MIRLLFILAVGLLAAQSTRAHETRPVFLELSEEVPATFSVIFRVPVQFGIPLPVSPVFDPGCAVRGNSDLGWDTTLSASARFRISCPHGLTGTRIKLPGLEATQVDALVRIRFLNGAEVGALLHPTQASYTVPDPGSGFSVFRTYLRLGLEHIAGGIDHLLFVTLLVLLIGHWRRILGAVTAFTIAHSISLALAALDIVRVPLHAVEASIALSILFLAVELAQPVQDRAFARAPWAIAFGFGLLHGLGFASGLAEIGLPHHEIPVALISFNLGVELGQFTCVGLLLALGRAMRGTSPLVRARALALALNLIGGVASYWTIQRTIAIFPSRGDVILTAPLSQPQDAGGED